MNVRGKKGGGVSRKRVPKSTMQILNSFLEEANHSSQMILQPGQIQEGVDEEVETNGDGLVEVETYADYWPAKLKIGAKHPDPIVETASLSSVESADIKYELKIPANIIKHGLLSALQLESIAYASQGHERYLSDEDTSRAGFLIGDGAGVGKGRTIAGIIFENYLHGRKKAIWISVSNDLKYDAERDLCDIGASKIEVHSMKKFKYNSRINSAPNGNIKEGVIFCTYAMLIGKTHTIGKFNSRLAQLTDWCGDGFDGCIVFDECHKAKNLIPVESLKPTKTGIAVLQLQQRLPKARVVYSSATGASEPRNMGYMIRLGLWGVGTPFRSFHEYQKTLERRGVGAMEIVAMDMKLRGMYVARQLSFQGVTFKIEEVPLTDDFKITYNESVALWNLALQMFEKAAWMMRVDQNTTKIILGQFWGAHQRFFKYMSIAAKVNHTVKVAKDAVQSGKCVVIGLQSTGEARMREELEKCGGELEEYVSTAKAVFQSLVEKQFPALKRNHKDSTVESNSKIKLLNTGKRNRTIVPKTSSRKRNVKNNPMTTQTRAKRARRISSSEELSDEIDDVLSEPENCDSDEDYSLHGTQDVDNESSSSEDEIMMNKEESDLEPDTESEISEDEQSSDFDTPSEDSDSEFEDRSKNKENIRPGGKPKNSLSKVQKYILEQHEKNVAASKTSSKNNVEIKQINGIEKDKGISLKDDIINSVCAMKDELLQKIEELGERLPPNTLDDLIHKLGGSEKVAEMTGRKGRVATNEDGTVQYESRSEDNVSLEMLNMTEKQRFMDGEKLIAIISEAASSGISLQSDRRVLNQRRRVHITLELPWSADRAIQQFGRTHRSNQVNSPEYMFLISTLAGERRFAATVAKRLESLGALTHADRRATQTRDLSQYNIDNKYGRRALASTMHAVRKYENPILPPPEDYVGDFFGDVHKALLEVGLNLHDMANEERKSDNIVRFLNRILGVPVDLQNRLFEYFSDTLNATILKAKRESSFDLGILDLGRPEKLTRMSTKRFLRRHATGIAPIELHTVRVDRGMSWNDALEKSKTLSKRYDGFYIYNNSVAGKKKAILVENPNDDDSFSRHRATLRVYRPNTGLSVTPESVVEIERSYSKVSAEKAENYWIYQYDSSALRCSHAFWNGNCKLTMIGGDCDVGMRITTRAVLSGSVLGVWDKVEEQLRAGEDDERNRMQVIRMQTNDGHKTIGILIPKESVKSLINELSQDAENIEAETFMDIKTTL